MTHQKTDVLICGAGIAGIAAAYFLSNRFGVRDVTLVDERPPLTLTSDKSTEAYRNWWPGPDEAMIQFMNRSIDLLEGLAEESRNVFGLNRRGYVYATGDPAQAVAYERLAEQAEAQGAGPARFHRRQSADPVYVPAQAEGYRGQPDGADLLLDQGLIRERFPYLSEQAVAVLHARRAGWFSGQQLGMYLLRQAQAQGTRFLSGRVEAVDLQGGRVSGVVVDQDGRSASITTPNFVNAAGPFVKEVGQLLGVDLPIFSEKHLKVSFPDHLGVVPRPAPLLIWEDPQRLSWSAQEQEFLAEAEETRWLVEPFPPGVHCRPEGGQGSQNVLVLWPYHLEPVEPVFPLEEDEYFPEVALRGMAAMIPGLAAYFERLPRPYVDGGYYTKTGENRLLCGPLPAPGAYLLGALSGYGLMAACAAGELLAAHLTGAPLPSYAPAFALQRYQDPEYREKARRWGSSGQL